MIICSQEFPSDKSVAMNAFEELIVFVILELLIFVKIKFDNKNE